MKLTLTLALVTIALLMGAQPTTRNVTISWVASTQSAVIGYNVFRSTSSSGPFVTPLNSTLLTGTSYLDTTAVIGSTYTYGIAPVAAPCTPTTPVATPCGTGPVSSSTSNIPAQPIATVTITIAIP